MQNNFYKINSRVFFLRIFFFLIIFLWVLGFSIPLIFSESNTSVILYPILHKFYSGVCHQLDYKSFSLFGYHVHVCVRCSGIYIGALICSTLSIFYIKQKHININFLYAGAIPLLIDILFQSVNIVPYIKNSAFLTGLIFGFTVFIFFLSAVENYLLFNKTKILI